MTRCRAVAVLAGWCAFLVAALVVLEALGHGPLGTPPMHDLGPWLEAFGPATAAFALLRVLLLALAWYLLAATAVSGTLRVIRADGLASAVERRAPVQVGRVVRAAMGLVAASVTITSAAAAAERASDDATSITMQRLPDDSPRANEGPPPVTMRRLADTTPVPDTTEPMPPVTMRGPGTWTIQPGDHLWRVAERTLEAAWRRPPTDGEVDPYWRRLIEHNRRRLRHRDDPDLVFPGDVIELPPT
ncbi:MAG TPA: hypothetical protein VM143_16215 [Acidimicrobiales bacterium]|nr:hypothetical protein [Acidimicrobiales bacterium]